MRRQRNSKSPKLRFRPGQFVRLKQTIAPGKEKGQLYCIVQIFRMANKPHVWLFLLEERSSLEPQATMFSVACERIVGGFLPPDDPSRTIWQPVRRSPGMIGERDYAHGDRIIATNQEMLGKFKVEG